jgi:general secretion pathway protein D
MVLTGIQWIVLSVGLATMVRAQEVSAPAAATTPGVELVPAPEPQVAAANQARVGDPGQPAAPARPPSNPGAQPAPRDRRQQGPRAAAPDAEQQIQFDRNGLVTMHVNELDVRQLLELLSRRSGLNILVSPGVAGTITANFENTKVEQVLKSVIKLANLVEKTEAGIHYLYSKGEIDENAEFTKREKIMTRVYRLNYVRSDELLAMIRPFLSVDVGQKRVAVTPSYKFGIGESATFVSGGAGAAGAGAGGASSANVGGPTNQGAAGGGSTVGGFQPPTGGNSMSDSDMLIIQDYESNLKIVDQIVKRVDTRPVQVLIEAVIISVDLEHSRQLGVNFALVDNLGTALGEIGSGASLNNNAGFNPTQLLTAAGKIAGSAADPTGLAGPLNGAKFGFVANNVTGFIQALETIGSTKILASPRILVLNKQRAEIQLGSRLGFQTFSQNFTSTIQQVQFLNTGTLLRIRPFISLDGMIRMEIHPERSSGSVTNNIPNQQTAELTTNVMVPDGATLVIGGLMEDEDDFQLQGLPGLSRIPALGYLFGFRQKSEARRELVVLLTPHIWSPELGMPHTVDPNAGPPEKGPSSPVERTPDADRPDGSVPSIAPLPPGASSDDSTGPISGEVTLVANTGTPASPRTASRAPASGTAATPTPPENGAHAPGQRRRGVLSSFMQRITGRGDSQNRDQARPPDARASANAARDSNLGLRKQIAPQPDAAPSLAPAPAAAARDSSPQAQAAGRVTQTGPTRSQSAPARADDRLLRTSAAAGRETLPAATPRPRSVIRPDSATDRPSRPRSAQFPPSSEEAGWAPAQPSRTPPAAGWMPATKARSAPPARSIDDGPARPSQSRGSEDN